MLQQCVSFDVNVVMNGFVGLSWRWWSNFHVDMSKRQFGILSETEGSSREIAGITVRRLYAIFMKNYVNG